MSFLKDTNSSTGLELDESRAVYDALHELRGGLANADFIDTALNGNLMPLLDLCLKHDDPDIQYSAVWILTNVACGDTDQTALVAARLDNVVPILTQAGVDDSVLVQGLWMLANIAGDCPEHRDLVIHHFPISLLEAFVYGNSSAQVLENVAWLLSNIARQGPRGNEAMCAKILDILDRISQSTRCDCKVISEICRAVLHILHNLGEPNVLDAIKESRILAGVVHHTNLACDRSCFPELVKLVADILSADDESCQVFIDQGVLNVLAIVMQEDISELYYFACFAVANVFACSSAQIQCAINHNLLTATIHHLEHGDFKIQKEAAIALCSFLGNAQERQVLQAFNKGLVPPMVQMLSYYDTSIVYDVLASLFNLLETAKDLQMEEDFLHEMLDSGIEKRVHHLMKHGHEQVSELALSFIQQYLRPHGTADASEQVATTGAYPRMS